MENGDPKYVPAVPPFIARILTLEKKYGRHYPFKCSGETKKRYNEYERRYSRKLKYARLNGWTVEKEK